MPPIPSVPESYLQDEPEVAAAGDNDDVPALRQLMEYGFSREQAVSALESTGYSFQRALNKLLSAPS
jgi:uncharacterized UBP type Zn finger protein